ncbi:MAG: tRNA (N6-isopentenyl adenosine(37)-C2)-methylthiotransferase MiaB [Deltaproteobacteria bacterium]|nr:tRNA (N6-isopentenyl adenosine(37)-C2)-methylthiotransferase MiaB [Deltaproteobacteria bacterium]
MKQIYVATFGCQMNEYDSSRLIHLLSGHGYTSTSDPEQADVIFINTCTIRGKAQQKVNSLLGRLRRLKAINPDLLLAVGGCVAQQEGAKLFEQAPYVDIVIGTHELHRLPAILEQVAQTRRSVCQVDFSYRLPLAEDMKSSTPPGLSKIANFLTIMQGCDNFCAYCVVPYVRGREISRPADDILAEARRLVEEGAREIILLGQNVNSYGHGLEPEISFAELLKRMAALSGILRLRFTTSHPKDLSPDLIRVMVELPTVAEHVHLPLQSGSDNMLNAMRRRYTRGDYLAKVEALRTVCPEMAITTDIIVGFPGETDDDFEQTLALVRQVRFDGMYSFMYSDRPRTLAAGLENKVPDKIKAERLAILQNMQKSITLECNQTLIGRRMEVLVEGRSNRYKTQLTGKTRGNKIVNFNGSDDLIGCLVHPLITEAWPNSLLGKIEENQK